MINVFNKNENITYFESIDELTNYCENTKSLRYNDSEYGSYSFTHTHSLSEAIKLCKYGDEELCTQIYNKSLEFNNVDTIDKHRQHLVNDFVGFTPNVPNYVMGIPTNMIRDDRDKIKSKIVNIFINTACLGNVNVDDILETATKFVCAINKLEECGYRCNIYSGCCGRNDYDYNLMIVKIKSDKEPLNLVKMAFPMCHPSFQRRLKFKWLETTPIDFGYGYGMTITDNDKISKLLKNIFYDTKFTILNVSDENTGDISDIFEQLKQKGMINNEYNRS